MNVYSIVKFLHVVGAIGYFVALGGVLYILDALRAPERIEPVRLLARLLGGLTPLFYLSVLTILAAGLYMAFTTWGFQTGWMDVALVILIIMFPIAGRVVGSRVGAIARMAQAAPDGELPAALVQRMRNAVL